MIIRQYHTGSRQEKERARARKGVEMSKAKELKKLIAAALAVLGASAVMALAPAPAKAFAADTGTPGESVSEEENVDDGRIDISAAEITLSQTDYTYTGSEIRPEVTVTLGGKELLPDVHYYLNYSSNTDAGEAAVTVIGTGDYKGQAVKTFTISPIDISGYRATIPYLNYTYTGKSIAPTPTLKVDGVKLAAGTDYTVSYSDNVNVGTLTARVTITGTGNYTGTTERFFNIKPNDLSDNRAAIPYLSYSYTGKARTPEPTLKVSGIKLVKGRDYTVSYSNNINVGTLSAKITITGKGNYTGTTVRYFNIKPNDLSDNRATIPSLNYTYLGKTIKPSPTLKISGVKLVSGRDYIISYKNNSAIGTATVTLTGKGNYTGKTSRQFNIVKAHGFYKIDGSTHYFDENGKEAKSCWAQGFEFDKKGAMTAKSEAFKEKIDKYTANILAKYGYDNDTPYSKLKTLFYHFEKNGYYYQKLANPNLSTPKWEMDAANYLLTYRKGNCQRYSALMAYLARAVGFDAVAQYHYYIRNIRGTTNWIHAWTEVMDGGKTYICDAELRIEIVRFGTSGPAPFMKEKKASGNYGPGRMKYYYAWAYN